MPITPYTQNSGGLNITDSPLSMQDNQATGQSYNYDYARTGAISKVLASSVLNTIADTQLKTVGLGVWHDAVTDLRTLIRCAGTKIQTCSTSTGISTNCTSDTLGATTDFLNSNSTQPAVFSAFNTSNGTQLWIAGAGVNSLYGYTGTTVTQNGVAVPTGSIGLTVNTHTTGVWTATGTYFYGVQFRKGVTQVFSNITLDKSATVVNADDTVTIDLTTISNIDTTLYDQIWIWRSAVAGVTGFTTGSIIAKVSSSTTSYIDTGTSIASAQNVARSGNTILDNTQLGTGSYTTVTTFKRRLITALNSTLYISDLDKPESWPLQNIIVLPSGGPILGLGTIGVPSEYTTGSDQYLCIWKERELWVLTGDNPDNWELLFVDKTGCLGQSLVVSFNGFVTWLTFNGIYIWDGRGKPARCSKPVQALFMVDGDLDTGKLSQGYATQYEKANEVIWRVSHRTKGTNKLSIKMDTRLTSLSAAQNLQNPEMDGVFILDTDSNAYYGLTSIRPGTEEILILGDDAGFVYQGYQSVSAVSFDYETKPLDMGAPEVLKSFKRVLVLVEKLTPNDLTMFFWADYRIRAEYATKVSVSMSPSRGAIPSLWDVAIWDQNLWDDFYQDISFIEFNLPSFDNNAQGTSLKLKFEQLEASAPVRIHGFFVEWEPANNLPIPTQQAV